MQTKIKIFLLSIVALALSACSHVYGENGVFKNREFEYMNARSIQPIRVPPGYSDSQIQDEFPVSTGNYSLADAKIDLTPPGLYDGYSTGH